MVEMLSPPKKDGDSVVSPSAESKQTTVSDGSANVLLNQTKPNNGWSLEVELLLAEWADKAICYRWMHERTERIYHQKDMSFMFPVIILSTVTGAANFALDSAISDPTHKGYAQLALGGLSILTGIISTIANRLSYGSGSEAHKSAGILWGKFQRLIAIELSLNPMERMECMRFLRICRTELDRLIEHSPMIPDSVIQACKSEFKHYPKVRKPELIGDIDTTHIYEDKGKRLIELAQDAALMLQLKKGVLKQIVLADLEPRINSVLSAARRTPFESPEEIKLVIGEHGDPAKKAPGTSTTEKRSTVVELNPSPSSAQSKP